MLRKLSNKISSKGLRPPLIQRIICLQHRRGWPRWRAQIACARSGRTSYDVTRSSRRVQNSAGRSLRRPRGCNSFAETLKNSKHGSTRRCKLQQMIRTRIPRIYRYLHTNQTLTQFLVPVLKIGEDTKASNF